MKLAFKRGRRGDNRNAVTVLSHVAVTSLLIHNQRLKCKDVTGDSKILLFDGSSSNSVLFYVLNPLILANSNFMFALLYICLLIAFNLLTVPSSTALFQE